MQAKLNPLGKVNFPGFQEILDFTSAGSESSVSVTIAADTDKEYKILVRNLDTADAVNLLLGGDTSTYGFQCLKNTAGTIAAARDTSEATIILCPALSLCEATLLTPTNFLKTLFVSQATYTSGTTMANYNLYSYVYDGTATFTSLDFSSASGNFTAGTRITVFARRTN
jgi:hypothetical protein